MIINGTKKYTTNDFVKNSKRNERSFPMTQLSGFLEFVQMYNSAIKEVLTKLEILDDEFKIRNNNNPIHHMESRLKSPESIIGKLESKNLEISLTSAKENLYDIAGIRVVCYYVKDIYKISELLLGQNDVNLLKIKDYIKNPKENGYRSLHLVVSIPVFLSDGPVNVPVEIQIRTVAMDFWASLEHQMRYKQSELISDDINKRLFDCAQKISELDLIMQNIHTDIQSGDKCE